MAAKPTYAELENRIQKMEDENTQLRETEILLHQSRAELAEIFSLSSDMICIADIKTATFIKINPAFKDTLGYADKELLGRSFLDFIHPDDITPTIEITQKKLNAGEKIVNFENRYRCSDGTIRWLEWSSQPVPERRDATYAVAHDVTKRHYIEEALQESETFVRTVMDNLPIGLAVSSVDPNVTFKYMNDNFLRCYRTTRADLSIPDGFWTAVYENPEFREEIRKKCLDDITTGDPARMIWEDVPITRKGEETTHITTMTTPIPGKDFMISTVWDVTARKKAEDALKETTRLLEETQAIAKLGGWSHDVASGRGMWTDVVFRIHGMEPGGEPLDIEAALACYVPAHRPLIEKAFRQAVLHGVPFDLELQLIQKDGTPVWIRTIGHPVVETGRVVRVTGYFMDITHRKEAELTLRKYERIVSTSLDIMAMVNTDYVYEAVNESFLRGLNKPNNEVVGHTVAEVMGAARFQKEFKPHFDQAFTGQIVKHRHLLEIPGSGIRIMSASLFPMINEKGDVEAAVVNVRDITETKKLEEQLMQSQKIESIGRLAGGVAHDLNNLLTPILAYSEMLTDSFGFNDNRKHKIEQIFRAGLKARDLVQQLLAFSRKQTLAYKPVDMNKVVSGFGKLLRHTIREDIDIDIILSSDVETVMADIGQVEQVIMNLAVNAADAMPEGGVLTIETLPVELDKNYAAAHQGVEPGQYVMLAVSDTGYGMDDTIREHLFEPFFSTKGEQGTGLGLATVYGIVKQHKGNIWVYSEPGNGTTFKIYLPVCEGAPVEEVIGQTVSNEFEGSETILLVEDNEIVRELGHAILKGRGYTVLVAASGEEALSLMSSHEGPVQLLLTDLIMPGMNGKELFTRAVQTQPDLKVLYMSGYTDNVIVHHGVLDEGVQFIQKPFTINGLVTKVREVLTQGGGS